MSPFVDIFLNDSQSLYITYKLKLLKINHGSCPNEMLFCKKAASFNNALINLTENKIDLIISGQVIFSSLLEKIEEDFLSKTYRGLYSEGIPFRLATSSEFVKKTILSQGKNDSITIASMKHDGYAVHYDIVK
jgi:hypothetical protein